MHAAVLIGLFGISTLTDDPARGKEPPNVVVRVDNLADVRREPLKRTRFVRAFSTFIDRRRIVRVAANDPNDERSVRPE